MVESETPSVDVTRNTTIAMQNVCVREKKKTACKKRAFLRFEKNPFVGNERRDSSEKGLCGIAKPRVQWLLHLSGFIWRHIPRWSRQNTKQLQKSGLSSGPHIKKSPQFPDSDETR